MFDYYGLDWMLLALGLTTKWLMIQQNRWAFLTSILGCTAGLAVALMSNQYGIAVFNIILIGMSVQGFFHWGKLAKQRVTATQTEAQTA